MKVALPAENAGGTLRVGQPQPEADEADEAQPASPAPEHARRQVPPQRQQQPGRAHGAPARGARGGSAAGEQRVTVGDYLADSLTAQSLDLPPQAAKVGPALPLRCRSWPPVWLLQCRGREECCSLVAKP